MKSYEKRLLPIRKTMIGLAILLPISFTTSSSFADVIPASTADDPTSLQADPPTGHQGFVALAPTMSNTGHVNTATAFTLGSWISTGVEDGLFAGMPTQTFGNVSFNITMPTSFTFGNSVFGTFDSTSIMDLGGPTGFRNIKFLGEWTPGSFGGVTGGPFPSEFVLGLTQTPPGTGAISASGTFGTPSPIQVPDGGMTLMLLGGALVGLGSLRRRLRV